jgi:hypothetical protein
VRVSLSPIGDFLVCLQIQDVNVQQQTSGKNAVVKGRQETLARVFTRVPVQAVNFNSFNMLAHLARHLHYVAP